MVTKTKILHCVSIEGSRSPTHKGNSNNSMPILNCFIQLFCCVLDCPLLIFSIALLGKTIAIGKVLKLLE